MALLNCVVYLMLTGIAGFCLGRILPKCLFRPDRFPYACYAFEKEGRIYNRLHIAQWQNRLPDMSRIFRRVMPSKRIEGRLSDSKLVRMVQETCVAEFIHILLCFTGLYVFRIVDGTTAWIVYWVYVLLGNLPFILIQRYNRPRLLKLLFGSRARANRLRSKEKTKKVLILSCNTGAGHNSCARAITETLEEEQVEYETVDALRFIAPWVSALVSKAHVWVYRHLPKLFKFAYRFSEKHARLFNVKSSFYSLLSLGTEPLTSYILDGGFNVVICTHVFPAVMLTEVRKRHSLNVRSGFVATDYTCSPGVKTSQLDAYFIPDASLTQEFTDAANPKKCIIDSGIPVRQQMYQHTDSAKAKEMLGLPADCRHLLVMCGSMGGGPLKWVMLLLALELEKNQYITLICGTNRRLKRKMERRYAHNPRIRICGFCDNVPLLMDSADLYLTKPGGLSTTEAAVKNLPMLMLNAVGGCEEYNKEFYVNLGLGVSAENAWSLSKRCREVFSNDARISQMREAGMQKKWKHASKVICDWALAG